MPIFGKKLTPGPLGPKKGPYGPSVGRFLATGPDFGPKIRFLLFHPGFCQWPVCNPRRYLRFGTFGSIFSGRLAARRAVFRPPGRIFARKSVFCYRTPDFVNGPFVALDDIFDLAPLDRFLNFSFPSYGCFREGDPQNGGRKTGRRAAERPLKIDPKVPNPRYRRGLQTGH